MGLGLGRLTILLTGWRSHSERGTSMLNFLLCFFGLKKHLCNCGTGQQSPHEVGRSGCVRKMKSPPKKKGENWIVNEIEISDYTLRFQRGYYRHPCGCWSSAGGSVNSLPDET